jgi:hypothetical protein
MKNVLGVTLRKAIALLIPMVLILIISLQTVFAGSETFPLSPMQTITRNVALQANDRLVGSFSVGNLWTWQNGWGDNQTYAVSVTVLDPKGQTVLSYTKTTGDSFDYTVFYSGVYTIQFGCGFEYLPPSGIPNPDVTLNYQVVSAVQETETPPPQIQIPYPTLNQQANQYDFQIQGQEITSTTDSQFNPQILVVFAGATAICVGVAVIAVSTRKRKQKSH